MIKAKLYDELYDINERVNGLQSLMLEDYFKDYQDVILAERKLDLLKAYQHLVEQQIENCND